MCVRSVAVCLSSLRLLLQNITGSVDSEQQTFIAHGSGGWKCEIRVPARSGEDLILGGRLPFVSSLGRRGPGAL